MLFPSVVTPTFKMTETTQVLEQLVQALTRASSNSSVNAVAFKAPTFWATNARAWFIRLEAAFATHQPAITNDLTKFHHVVQLLDSSTSRRVQAVLEDPPATGKYEAIKSALLAAFEATQFQKDSVLLNLNGLGDRRPSELLQYMRSLNSDPKTLFRTLFLLQLPPEVRRILSQSDDTDLDSMARTADNIMAAELPASASVAATSSESSCHTDLDSPSQEVNWINARAPKKESAATYILCKYHGRFGPKARRCEKLVNGKSCAMNSENASGSKPNVEEITDLQAAELDSRFLPRSVTSLTVPATYYRSHSARFLRKDGGRHSLRSQKSSPTPPTSARDSKPKSREISHARSTGGTSSSTPAANSARASSARTPTSRTPTSSSTAAAKTQDYEAWKRRKTYDPRKSLAAPKSKKDEKQQQQQRRTRSAGVVGTTDQWGRSSLSSEESSSISYQASMSRTAEISQLNSSMSRDLASMTRNVVHDSDEALKALSSLSSHSSTMASGSKFANTTLLLGGGEGGGRSAFSVPQGGLAAPVPLKPTQRRVLSAVSLTTPATAAATATTLASPETYDDLLVSSVYQLSMKLRAQ